MTLSKPALVGFHDLSGVDSLPYIVNKTRRYFFAATNVAIVSIGQLTAEQRQRKAMATELLARASQLRVAPLNAQRSEQLSPGIAG